jgi:hypothetical protein
LIFLLAAALALSAMLLAGCGGGADPGAKVEDSLQDYLGATNPEQGFFLVGAGSSAHTYAGITCKWPSTTPDGVAICQLATGTGFRGRRRQALRHRWVIEDREKGVRQKPT